MKSVLQGPSKSFIYENQVFLFADLFDKFLSTDLFDKL